MTPAQVLSKASAARGEVVRGVYHRVVQSTGANGDTWQTDSYQDDQDNVEKVDDGGFETASGSYHGISWDRDANGTVMLTDDFHTIENPFRNAIENASSAQSDIHVLGITTGDPAYVVLELKPLSGLLQRRYYDASTFLLHRVETTGYDGRQYSYTYGDYRKQYGVTYASSISYADAEPENAWTARVQTFEPVSPSSVNFAIPPSRPVFDLGGRSSVEVPADFTDRGIIVRVTVGNRGLDFQLDSGSSGIVIDSGVAQQLGLRIADVRKASFGGDYSEGRTRFPELALGDLHANDVAALAIPFTRMLGDRKVVGLLGGDFFSSARIAVDFAQNRLEMLAPSASPMTAPWVGVPIQTDDLVPRARAEFNGVAGAFVIDLGADDTMLYDHYFHRFKPNGQGDVLGQVEGVAGQRVDFRKYTFSRFAIGSMEFADASVMVAQSNRFEDTDYDGLIGRNMLSNFDLIFDYSSHMLYMKSLMQ